MPEYLFTPTSGPAIRFPDYDYKWLESIGFQECELGSMYQVDVGYDSHTYYLTQTIYGEWSLSETIGDTSINLPTPMTKVKVLEYIAFVKGMVNQ